MARNVSVHIIKANHQSVKTCTAFAQGIEASGDKAVKRSESESDLRGFDAVVLWGFVTPCQIITKKCRDRGIPWVFMDMGYWRREQDYYKVAVNDRHSTAYFMRRDHDSARWDSLGVKLQPRQNTSAEKVILVPGMSGKAAWSFGMADESYEQDIIAKLQTKTKRQLVYRPKPTFTKAKPIPGSAFDKNDPLDQMLAKTHCVVGHHSNVGSDALVAGVPVQMKFGIASHTSVCMNDLALIEAPFFPDTVRRQQWAYNAAYCQWSVKEMATGACWRWLKQEQLV